MRKQAIGTATIPAVGGAGKFAGLAAPALAKRGAKIRGLAPNAKQGEIVRKHGAAEIAIADLRDRASLDAALEDGDAVCDIEPAVLRRRAVLPLMKGRGWGRVVGEYGITVNVLAPGL